MRHFGRIPRRLLAGLVALWAGLGLAGGATSSWVFPAPGGRLLFARDALGNRVPDFSNTGFQEGATALPVAPVRATVSPAAGDDAALIQAAIDAVSALPPDAAGFRGAVLLAPGEYQIAGDLRIQASGVVLRGSGSGPTGTVLRATGPGQRTLVRVSTDAPRSNGVNTTRTILDTYVPVGARSFTLSSTNGYAPGDRVLVKRPSTQAWIDALGMNQLNNPWTPGSRDIQSDRRILALESNRVHLDAPLVCALDAAYGGGTIQKYTWPERLRLVGIEDLRGISDFTSATNEDHGWIFIEFKCIEDGWVRRVVSQHFGFACVSLDTSAQHITVEDCEALDPVSQIIGNRRYGFVLDDAELCLIRHCRTRQDRHHFVTQSNTDGPNAFVDGFCEDARNDVGPHQRWATGALWDNIEVNGHLLNIQNRGNLGTGHGWAGANCLGWNCFASGGFIVQSPPTARNWLVGSVGPLQTGTNAVGPVLPGTIDSHGAPVFPRSLHAAQLQQRLAAPGLQFREHVAGDFDLFLPTNGPAGGTPVEPAWLDQVASTAGGTNQVIPFDTLTPRKWVAWSHPVLLRPGEQLLSASLSLSLRATGPGWTSDRIYFDRLSDSPRLTNYATTLTTTGSTVVTIDLADRLAAVADGRLDLALQDEVAVDWSVLEWTLAPSWTFLTNVLAAEADALVRGGAYATQNSGTATRLATKEDFSEDVRRRSFLRWDLSSLTGQVVHAAVRLVPVTVNLDGVENTAAVAGNAWTESGVTWSNQPPAGRAFASWPCRLNVPVEFPVTAEVQAALQGDRRLTLQIASARDVGSAGFVEYASREYATASLRPQLLVLITNTPPVLSPLPSRLLLVNRSTGPLPFTVGDGESPATALTVTATSSNSSLIPPSGLILGGSGSNRTLTVTHSGSSTGATWITLAASDGLLTTRTSWRLTVVASNTPPTLVPPAAVTVPEDSPAGPLAFTVGDRELPAEDLQVFARSSNPNLIPDAHLLLGGTGSNRTLLVTPRTDTAGQATISLQVTDGALSVTGAFTVVVQPVNDPPSRIVLTSPVDGQRTAAGDAVILLAEAADPDDTDLQVRFLADGAPVATALDGPYRQAWVPPNPGRWVLHAVATDPSGLSRTSAPVRLTVDVIPVRLVSFGSAWRYQATLPAPPSDWFQPAFDDAAWPLGSAPLGYGNGDEATVLGAPDNRPAIAWFRHRFTLPPEPPLASLMLRVVRDDGVRVWLNGNEVFRDNLPSGALDPQSTAVAPVEGAAESVPVTAALTPATLVPGTNVLAAEVRQANPPGEDLGFNLELLGYPPEALPQLQVESIGGDLRLRWPAWATGFTLQASPGLGPQAVWAAVPGTVSIEQGQATMVVPQTPFARFFRLLQP